MDPLTIIGGVAAKFGIDPTTLLLLFGVIIAVSNLIGRLIPDDAEGILGLVRKVAKFLGLYLSNRVTAGVTVNSIAKASVGVETQDATLGLMQTSGALPPENGVVLSRDEAGKFQSLKSPWYVGIMVLFFLLVSVGLSGCATTSDAAIGQSVCTHQIALRLAANQAMTAANLIKDATQRQIAIDAAQATLDLVNACPQTGIY